MDGVNDLAASCCGQVRSAIMAGALGGPAIHTLLSASLISMLTVLRATLAHAFNTYNGSSGTSSNNTVNTSASSSPQGSSQTVSPTRLIAAMPHLMALARIHLPHGFAFGPSLPPPRGPQLGPGM